MTSSDAARPAREPFSRQSAGLTLPRTLLVLGMVAYAVYFSFLTVTRYQAFEARALDMGNLNQAIWNTAHGDWFRLTNQPGIVNRLSLHVEPIIVPIAWLYRLWPDPRLLLILQACVIALGALPLFAFGRDKLKSEWPALIFALAFLLHPSLQAANWLEFHPLALAPTCLLAAFYFLTRRRTGWFALCALLAAACKEEIGLLVFMLGLYAFVVLKQRRLGVITMALSAAWALLAVLVIQNTFAAGNIHWARYAYLGDSPAAILQTLITQPGRVWRQLIAAQAFSYLGLLMLPTGFLSLAGLELLLLALPSLGINLLADFAPMHQADTLIYAAPIVPFVMVAGVVGAERLSRRLTTRMGGRNPYPLFGALVLGSVLVAQLRYGYLPGGGNHRLYPITDHHRRAAAIIAQIPPEAKVSAQDKLNPHVSGRATVYIFPRIDDADTIFLDVSGPAWPIHPSDLRAEVDRLLAAGWGVAAADDGYLLLRKNSATQRIPPAFYGRRIPPAFYDRWKNNPPADATTVAVDFDGQLRLIGYAVATDHQGELITNLYWQALNPPAADLHLYVAYLDRSGAVLHDSLFYPPVASLWYPTQLWTPGTTVQVTTLPWTLENDQFTLAVGLFQGPAGWTEGGRLPITGADPALPLLEAGTLVRLGGFARAPRGEWTAVKSSTTASGREIGASFGRAVVLTHAAVDDAAVAGQPLEFTLFWKTVSTPTRDDTVFAHLLDAAGNKVAQKDWQPSDLLGPRPMTGWRPGEQLADTQTLLLPESLPAGDYRLIVGLYDWKTGTRLPVTGAHVEADQAVEIGLLRAD